MQTVSNLPDSWSPRIRIAGLRVTRSRLAVLDLLARSSGAMSHAQVAGKLADRWDRVTVFRNLVDLTDVGLIHRFDPGDHTWRYELRVNAQGESRTHPHLVCIQCGEVQCLPGVQVRFESRQATVPLGPIHGVQVQGTCSACA